MKFELAVQTDYEIYGLLKNSYLEGLVIWIPVANLRVYRIIWFL
jgi:hypothetical protein